MSNLSGFDSEAVGFESVSLKKREEATSSTQTTIFSEVGAASQTNASVSCGSTAKPDEIVAQDVTLKYSISGLNEFLRKVVPTMLEQLDEADKDIDVSDSDEEEVINAKLLQKITYDQALGSGDASASVLDISWSSAGNNLAISIGKTQHEDWCTHNGLIKIYTTKRSAGDVLVHNLDITEKNCIAVLKYHPSVPLLAYGTSSGEVVLCNLRSTIEEIQLTSPAGCHGSKRVSALRWADQSLANIFITIHINNTGKRIGSSQILMTAGSDGSLNIWLVNLNNKLFECIVSYSISSSRKTSAPDITCFDFIKGGSLRSSDDKFDDNIFVVGSKSGKLYLCKIKASDIAPNSLALDPVYDELEGHATCILNVVFNGQKPGVFLSLSIDSELRIYDVNQNCPLKVFYFNVMVSCMSWVPNNPYVVMGLAKPDGQCVEIFNIASGKNIPVEGLTASGESITALTVSQDGTCRIAAGDLAGSVYIWELPLRRLKHNAH